MVPVGQGILMGTYIIEKADGKKHYPPCMYTHFLKIKTALGAIFKILFHVLNIMGEVGNVTTEN